MSQSIFDHISQQWSKMWRTCRASWFWNVLNDRKIDRIPNINNLRLRWNNSLRTDRGGNDNWSCIRLNSCAVTLNWELTTRNASALATLLTPTDTPNQLSLSANNSQVPVPSQNLFGTLSDAVTKQYQGIHCYQWEMKKKRTMSNADIITEHKSHLLLEMFQ